MSLQIKTKGNTNICQHFSIARTDGDAIIDDSALVGDADDILEDDDVLNVSLKTFIYCLVCLNVYSQDDELDEETKSLLNSSHEDVVLDDPIHEDAVLKTPPGSKSPEPIADTVAQQKKVVLKRKLIIATPSSINPDPEAKQPIADESSEATPAKIAKIPISATITATTDSADAEDDKEDVDKKSAVKLSQLSVKERIEMRAKKFGIAAPVAGDAVKLARAERFGLSSTEGDKNGTSSSASVSVDVLKKRAERFGGSVSKVMNKIENLEKLQKRQERFGNAASSTNKSLTSKEHDEKARLRAERFSKAAVK